MRSPILPVALMLLSACLLASCGGGSGGGGGGGGPSGTTTTPEVEPNGTPGTATPLAFGEAGTGAVLAPGEQDYWSFVMSAPGFVRIEILGSRLDQATWDAIPNVPMLTLFDVDGTSVLGQHDFDGDVLTGGASLGGNGLDRDFSCHWLPAAGTYFVRVAQDTPASAGGSYAVKLTALNLGALQTESEAAGATGGNDTTGTADAIVPGELKAFMAGGDVDVYSFIVSVAPAIAVFDFKAWQLGGQANAIDYPLVDAQIIGPDGVSPLAAGLAGSGFGFDPLVSTGITTPGMYFLVVTPDTQGQPGYYHIHHELRQVGPLTETEGNNLVGTANALAEGQYVSGMTSSIDPDVFSFTATAGDMRAIRLWTGSNLENGGNNASAITVIGPDGMTVVPSTIGITNTYSLTEWRYLVQQSGTHYAVLNATGVAVRPYILRNVRNRTAGYENEPNSAQVDAGPLDADGRVAGVMDAANDEDWFEFTAQADELVRFDLFGGASVSGLDLFRNVYGSGIAARLTIFTSGGAPIAQAERVGTSNGYAGASGMTERIASVSCAFVAPSAGTYYVRVEDAAGGSGAAIRYLLERR